MRCRFTTLSPEFGSTYGAHGEARWVNVLKLRSYGTNDNLALTLPSSFTNESARRLRLSEPTLISREGFVLPQKYKHHSEYFRLMTGRDAVIDWLKQRGIDAQPSDPGRIAEQVLLSLKGFWGANLLADCDTIKLLDEMAKSVRKHADGKVEEFPDRSVEVKRWRDLVNRRSARAWIWIWGHPRRVHRSPHTPARFGAGLHELPQEKLVWDRKSERAAHLRALPENLCVPARKFEFSANPVAIPRRRTLQRSQLRGGRLQHGSCPRRVCPPIGGAITRSLPTRPVSISRSGKSVPFEVDFTFWYQREQNVRTGRGTRARVWRGQELRHRVFQTG